MCANHSSLITLFADSSQGARNLPGGCLQACEARIAGFWKEKCEYILYGDGDPTFAPATVAPVMISRTRVRVRVMIGFLDRGRVRIKISFRVRVGVTFNVCINFITGANVVHSYDDDNNNNDNNNINNDSKKSVSICNNNDDVGDSDNNSDYDDDDDNNTLSVKRNLSLLQSVIH